MMMPVGLDTSLPESSVVAAAGATAAVVAGPAVVGG